MKSADELFNYFFQLEKEFNNATNERGAEGWTSFFAEDGVMVGKEKDIVGKDAIFRAMDAAVSTPGFTFKWEPTKVVASDDGTMVFSYGNYERSFLNKLGERQTVTGKYTTIWTKQMDGSYKIIHDIGN